MLSLFRLFLKAMFSRDAESRYQAAKHFYWKIPLSSDNKARLRYFILQNTAFIKSRERAAANSIGRRIDIKNELAATPKMLKSISRMAPEDESWILVVNTWIPEPDKNSGSVRLFAILQLLKENGHKIVFASLAEKKYHWLETGNVEQFQKNFSNLSAISEEVIFGRESIGEHIYRHGYRYKYVYLSFPDVVYELLPTVRAYSIHANVIYDTVDLHGVRFRREAELTQDQYLYERADYYDRIERNCARNVDTIIAITDIEKKKLFEITGNAEIGVIPNVHSINAADTPFNERTGLLFIGHFQHTPNQDAVVYFVEEVLPLIQESIPDIQFTVLGSGVTDNVKKLACDNVDIIGYVDDPMPYFSNHRVFVAPLRYGAGMKGKTGQSMSLGLPLVTSSIGAEGMDLEHNSHVLIGDNPAKFANEVMRLYTDQKLWNLLRNNSLQHIEDHYSFSVVRKALGKIIKAPASVKN